MEAKSYELTRTADHIAVKVGGKILKVYLGDLSFLRKLDEMMRRLPTLSGEDAEKAVARLLDAVLGAENMRDVRAFYGENEAEMAENLTRFLAECYVPALAESVKRESRRRAGLDAEGEGR